MRISAFDKKILIGALRDLRALQSTPMPGGYGAGQLKIAVRDAADGIVRLAASKWLDYHSDDANFRMAASRCYAKLERYGLLNRVRGGWSSEQTTHLELLPPGIALAESFAAEVVDG